MRLRLALLFLPCIPLMALEAQSGVVDTGGAPKVATTVDSLVATSRVTSLVGIASSANQGTVGAADLALRPLLRPGEVVENIPGAIVTQHSGSGKANQYFLRGFNLDHGTDLAIGVDGVPVNMPSHAHGQGYADLNFLIPELVQQVDFKKGPYYADVGDFGSAGAFDVRYYDRLPTGVLRTEGGQVGYGRLVAAANAGIGEGTLMYGAEYEHNNGPWSIGDDEQKVNGVMRYALGTARDGVTLTAMGYHNDWRSTDQVPDRAIADGSISPFGSIDSTDAGNTGRYSLSANWHHRGDHSTSQITTYALHYDLDLFSDFTYFLDDPVHGDQIEQQDRRFVFGGTASHTWVGSLFGASSQNTIGFEARNDDIDNGLYHTEHRLRLDAGDVNQITETSAAPYVENRTYWTGWLRTIVGLRGDTYWFDVHNIAGGTSGNTSAGLVSPKASLILGPWGNTEFYLDGGYGFHSNDARGIVATVDPASALARSTGGEFGVRTGAVRGLQTSLSLWLLDLSSELVWDGDAGTNSPSGPTRRYGIEFANYYTPVRWLTIDADYAWSHTRYTDHESAGNYVPEALVSTFDGGLALHQLAGPLRRFDAGLRLRYFGPRPLTQNDSVGSAATSLVYAQAGYALSDRWTLGVAVFNLLDIRASDIDYYYISRLPGEPLAGVADIHTHPTEPRQFRISLTSRLGGVKRR